MEQIINDNYLPIMELFLTIISSIVGLAIAAVALKVRTVLPTWIGMKIDQRRQEDLHKAIMTQVRAVMLDGKNPVDVFNEIVGYVRTFGAPEAIAHFGLDKINSTTNGVLMDLVKSKVTVIAEQIGGLSKLGDIPTVVVENVENVENMTAEAGTAVQNAVTKAQATPTQKWIK